MNRSEKVAWVGVVELVTPMGVMRFTAKPADSQRMALWNAGLDSAAAGSPLRKAEEQAKRFRHSFGSGVSMELRVSAERVITVTELFVKSHFHSVRSA